MDYNKVILIGRLTRETELTYTPNQTAVCKFGLAVNYKYKDKEDVCFVDCVAFGKPAENIQKYVDKGQELMVEGRLKFDTWKGKDGKDHARHSIVVERFTFVSGQKKQQAAPAQQSAPPPPEEEDIPF